MGIRTHLIKNVFLSSALVGVVTLGINMVVSPVKSKALHRHVIIAIILFVGGFMGDFLADRVVDSIF